MRKLLSFLSIFLCLATFAQDFPVTVSNPFSFFGPETIRGGYKNNTYALINAKKTAILLATPSTIGNLYSLNAGFGPQPGKLARVKSVTVSSEKPVTVQLRIGTATGYLLGTNLPEQPAAAVLTKEGGLKHTFYVDWPFRNGQSLIVYVTNLLEGDSAWVAAYADVTYITDDVNDVARKTIKVIGTSISNGSGPDRTDSMYIFMLKDWFRLQGASVKLEIDAISGSTSNTHKPFFGRGYYDLTMKGTPPDLVILELAVNDAASGLSVATSVANYSYYARKFLNHPEKKDIRVIIQSTTPLQNNTWHTNGVALNTGLQNLVTSLKADYGDRIMFVDLSTSFDRTLFTFFASTDTNGSGIHPNNAGSSAIANVRYIPWFQTASDAQKCLTWLKK